MSFRNIEPGEEFKLNFSLNITGTKSRPSDVRVCFGHDTKLCVSATQVENDDYEAIIPPIEFLVNDSRILASVEVILNGRLIVPYRELINVTAPVVTLTQAEPTPPDEPVTPETQPPAPAIVPEVVEHVEAVAEPEPAPPHPTFTPEMLAIFDQADKQTSTKTIKFERPKIDRDKIIKKPIRLDLAELVEEPSSMEVDQPQPTIEVPFKLTKTKIVEK